MSDDFINGVIVGTFVSTIINVFVYLFFGQEQENEMAKENDIQNKEKAIL